MHPRAYLASILVILASYLALRTSIAPLLARFRTSFATHASPNMTTRDTTRTVVKSVHAIEQDEGVGARVRRSIGGMSLRHADPFLMLDHFTASKGAGFPSHPHRVRRGLVGSRLTEAGSGHADSRHFGRDRSRRLDGSRGTSIRWRRPVHGGGSRGGASSSSADDFH